MVSTTDDAEHSWRIAAGTAEPFTGIGVDDPGLLDRAAEDGGSPALRGHPGGPGFSVPDDGPPGGAGPAGRSVWQQAHAAWRSAGEEWRRPADGQPPAPGNDGALADPAAQLGTQALAAAYPPLPGGPPGPYVPAPRLPSAPDRAPARGRRPSRAVLLAVAVVVVIAAGAGGYVAFGAAPGTPPGYPAARLAGSLFGAGRAPAGQGVFSSISRVVSEGDTAVAVGSQSGGDEPRAQFFVSRDGGTGWKLAAVAAAGGGAPPPGHAAELIAAGTAGWLAVGPQSVWTSRNGESWTLTSSTGISPADTGDQVWVLTQTAGGFLAAGQNAAEGTGVIWTSANGSRWRRMTAAQLSLGAAGVRVRNISFAAASGDSVVISGEVARDVSTGRGKQRHTVVTHSAAAWLSTDGGTTWHPVTVPADHGASAAFSGIAADGSGFIAVRPGSTTVRHGRQVHHPADGVVYASANGSAWRYAGTLTAPGGLTVGAVKGGAGGFTAVGETQEGGNLGAYASPDGASWRQAAALGPAAGRAVTGATVTASGAVIAVGGSSGQDRRQPFLAVASPGRAARAVAVGAIPGATITQIAADAIGVSGGQQVAVGAAGGSPAIWTATGRGPWSPVAGLPPAASAPAGPQQLGSVVHGPAGWLATGGTGAGTAGRPLVLTSPGGAAWQSASGDPAFAGAGLLPAQAAAGRPGYVIVGADVTGTGTFPAAWSSSDLSTWTRAAGLAGVAGQMLGATATASGFVAVGASGIHPAVWTSPDGQTWHQASLPLPGNAASAQLVRVAASGRRIVAVGDTTSASGTQAAFAEVSANGGATWRHIRLRSPRGSAVVTAVVTVPGGFVVTGGYGAPGSRDVAVWTSANGARWAVRAPRGTGLSGAGIQQITGLTAAGGALTGVGFTATPTAEQPTLWHVPASLAGSPG